MVQSDEGGKLTLLPERLTFVIEVQGVIGSLTFSHGVFPHMVSVGLTTLFTNELNPSRRRIMDNIKMSVSNKRSV